MFEFDARAVNPRDSLNHVGHAAASRVRGGRGMDGRGQRAAIRFTPSNYALSPSFLLLPIVMYSSSPPESGDP